MTRRRGCLHVLASSASYVRDESHLQLAKIPTLPTAGAPLFRIADSPGVDKTKAKRNLFDNASNLLTNLLAGSNLKNMPVAEGAVTDPFDRPLLYSLYDWFLQERGQGT